MAKGTTAFVSVSNTCLTARLEIAVFYVPLPTIENVEICWKRRKIGHYRAVQFSEREAVSISPKQSVVGSTPTGLNPQTSNSFWLMFSRASCQTREGHRLERIFLPSIGNLLFAPLLALLAAFQHFAFFANTAVLANGRFA